jgi:hypothetical protein
MPNNVDGLRDLVVTTASGKDVRDTQMLTGEAKQSKQWNETNETKQYEASGNNNQGPLGGVASGK